MVLVALEVALLSGVLYIAGVCIYRIFFHPLAKYPGPLLGAITDWYPAYFTWKGELLDAQTKWRKDYGDIVRHGPNSLSFFGLEAATQIYGVRSNVSKSEGYATMSASRTPNLISATDKTLHGFKRRVISQTLTEESLKSMEPRIVARIEKFVELLGEGANDEEHSAELEGWTPRSSLQAQADWLTFDVMSDLLFGKSLGLLDSPDARWLPSVVRKIAQLAATSLLQPSLMRYKLGHVLMISRRKEIKRLGKWVSQLSSARAKVGNDVEQKDIFYAMQNAVDPKTEKSFNGKELWTESLLLMVSGSDTTSSTLAAVIHYLLHHPEWLASATKEIRSTYTSADAILLDSTLSSCKTFLACVDETQRLTPTAPNGPPREVDSGGIVITGHHLAQGTNVSSPIYHLQREEQYFASPNSFRPDRWLVHEETAAEDEERIKHQRKAHMPFHIGPRSCPGWRLARMELEITLARMLFLYDIKLAPDSPCCAKTPAGESCDFKMKAWIVSAVEGPFVQFRPRNMGAV